MTVYLLDVDGVLVGKKRNFNFPLPNTKVIEAIKAAKNDGHYISLCTGRPLFAITEIVEAIGLDTYHIADGGTLIANLMRNEFLQNLSIENNLAKKVTEAFMAESVYLEVYTNEAYFIQNDLNGDLLEKHIKFLQKDPVRIDNLVQFSAKEALTKIFIIAKDIKEKEKISELFENTFAKDLLLTWSHNPNLVPAICGWVSPFGISKGDAVLKLSKELNIPASEFVGVGDSASDWSFMKLCGKAAAMGNADIELKNLVMNDSKCGVLLPHIDRNGVLDVFKS